MKELLEVIHLGIELEEQIEKQRVLKYTCGKCGRCQRWRLMGKAAERGGDTGRRGDKFLHTRGEADLRRTSSMGPTGTICESSKSAVAVGSSPWIRRWSMGTHTR